MGTRRLVYGHTIEGMYLKGHPTHLTPALKAELKRTGIDLDKKIESQYSADVVNECTRVLRRIAYAGEPDDAVAYTRMGEAIVDGYYSTMMGKAFAKVLQVIGYRKVLDRLPSAMSSGSNYAEVNVTWQSQNALLIELNDVTPHWGINLGVLRRGFTHHLNAKTMTVELHAEKPPGAVYRMQW